MFALCNAPRLHFRKTLPTARTGVPFALRTLVTHSKLLDITQEIKLDHDNVKELSTRFQKAGDQNEKTRIANTLIREMSIHGGAEEVFYNNYTRLGLDDDVKHDNDGHTEVEKLVCKAEHGAADLDGYDAILSDAVDTFLAHAAEEERVHHPKMLGTLTAEENDKLARAFISARKLAPTCPHPFAPHTGGLTQEAMGMYGLVQDKMIESIQQRQYVHLKFEHPQVY